MYTLLIDIPTHEISKLVYTFLTSCPNTDKQRQSQRLYIVVPLVRNIRIYNYFASKSIIQYHPSIEAGLYYFVFASYMPSCPKLRSSPPLSPPSNSDCDSDGVHERIQHVERQPKRGGSHHTGARAKAWCLLIHADASLSQECKQVETGLSELSFSLPLPFSCCN